MKTWLPDINVWLALTFDKHANHLSAIDWMNGLTEETVHFCRFTQQGFLRLATNVRAVGDQAVSMRDAWKLYDTIFADNRVAYANEPSGFEGSWRHLTQLSSMTPNTWGDATLAALAITSGFELVTFDRGFGKFGGLSWTRLS